MGCPPIPGANIRALLLFIQQKGAPEDTLRHDMDLLARMSDGNANHHMIETSKEGPGSNCSDCLGFCPFSLLPSFGKSLCSTGVMVNVCIPPLQGGGAEMGKGMFGDRRKGCGQRQTRKKERSKGSLFRVQGIQRPREHAGIFTSAHVTKAAPGLETFSSVSFSRLVL